MGPDTCTSCGVESSSENSIEEEAADLTEVAEEEEKDVVRMKCGCTLDTLHLHTSSVGVAQTQCSNMCGGRADPEVPVSAKPKHSVCCFLIPCISV